MVPKALLTVKVGLGICPFWKAKPVASTGNLKYELPCHIISPFAFKLEPAWNLYVVAEPCKAVVVVNSKSSIMEDGFIPCKSLITLELMVQIPL